MWAHVNIELYEKYTYPKYLYFEEVFEIALLPIPLMNAQI